MDCLASADQVIPDWLVRMELLGEAKTAIGLGIQSWFGGVGLAPVTPFGAYCLF